MAQKKKLQVFVSSTFTDLQEERQAAVQAILTAGHIPAGMELFAAGDDTQVNVIKRWIDESDVYMLILGGRYGSIEPKSQKSYIHLEYEYALEKRKPLFAVVIDENHLEEKVKKDGLKSIEKDHSEKLKEFRELVSSKMVKFWKDSKDIKLAVMETMAEFSNRLELIGWITGNQSIDTGAVAEEIARLTKENSELRDHLASLEGTKKIFNGLSFEELFNLLTQYELRLEIYKPEKADVVAKMTLELLDELRKATKDEITSLLHCYWILRGALGEGYNASDPRLKFLYFSVRNLIEFGLVKIESRQSGQTSREVYVLSDTGKQFLLRLRLEKGFNNFDKYKL